MNREEAKQALEKGFAVSHRYFTVDEYVMLDRSSSVDAYVFEDDVLVSKQLFWADRSSEGFDDGWNTVNLFSEEKCFALVGNVACSLEYRPVRIGEEYVCASPTSISIITATIQDADDLKWVITDKR